MRKFLSMTALVAVATMASPAAMAGGLMVENYDVPYQSKWEPATPAPRPVVESDCWDVMSTLTPGKVLHRTGRAGGCGPVQEDGDRFEMSVPEVPGSPEPNCK